MTSWFPFAGLVDESDSQYRLIQQLEATWVYNKWVNLYNDTLQILCPYTKPLLEWSEFEYAFCRSGHVRMSIQYNDLMEAQPDLTVLGYSLPEVKEKLRAFRQFVNAPNYGYIYFAQHTERPDEIKIGRSKRPVQRVKQLSTKPYKTPQPVNLLAIAVAENCKIAERDMHRALKSQRIEGEWFRFTEESIEAIKELNNKFYNPKG